MKRSLHRPLPYAPVMLTSGLYLGELVRSLVGQGGIVAWTLRTENTLTRSLQGQDTNFIFRQLNSISE